MHSCSTDNQQYTGHQLQVEGGAPCSLLSTGEAVSGVLCLVLGSPVQARYRINEGSLVQSYKDG